MYTFHIKIKKSNLHYICGIIPKRIAAGGAHPHGLTSGPYSSEETSQRWPAVSDLTGPGIEPTNFGTGDVHHVFNRYDSLARALLILCVQTAFLQKFV